MYDASVSLRLLDVSIKSSAGETKVDVTGEEEYEIDQQISGLTEETRKVLIDNRLITLEDLRYRQAKWVEYDNIEETQKELLKSVVEKYEAEMVKRDEEKKEEK